ncbi:MAG: DNA/RNA non-specific endonuclease [Treponema sp.]|nr:DNA/RNA non-specific endonuclease [Treponema sp.]
MIFARKIVLNIIIFFSLCCFLYSQGQREFVLPEENSALYFGNPSPSGLPESENYILEKKQFVISYNSETLCPNWVSWHLSALDLGDSGRSNDFRPDYSLPEKFYAVKKSDYQFVKYGFDRGHVCPSADRSDSKENNSVTFLMTNMLPQCPDLNRIVWKDLESYERELASGGNELYIIAGGAGKGGESQKGYFESIPLDGMEISVPAFCWKIILVLPEGSDDFSRVNPETEIISVFMPNRQGIQNEATWKTYLCSVDYIEGETGLDFFRFLPDDVEDVLEARIFSADR